MQSEIKHLENVTVHIEPYSLGKHTAGMDEGEIKEIIDKLAKKAKTSLSMKRTVTYVADGKRYINIDCCFTRNVPLTRAHELASQVEKEITQHYANVKVTVHIEPE